MSRPPSYRVCIVPEYPMSFISGGLQMQAREIHRALEQKPADISVEMFEWAQARPLADLYHFIGFPSYLHRIAEFVRQARRPYACTIMMGNSCQRIPRMTAAFRHRLKAWFSDLRGKPDPVVCAQAVLTITPADAEAVRQIFGVERSRIHIVPHGVNDAFYQPSPLPWQSAFGKQPFALCVGAIQERKGQLGLVTAGNQLKLPVVLLGPVLLGEASYAKQVEAAMQENEKFGGRWIQHLQNDDPLLISAFGACQLFVLLSNLETQPISVLQALAARKPVLLLAAPYTRHPPFESVRTVKSLRASEVCRALQDSWNCQDSVQLSEEFRWDRVADRLREVYLKVLSSAE